MIITNSDGGARGNPGPAAVGIVLRKNGKIIKKFSEKIGKATNNIAEYKALIKALQLAKKYEEEVSCFLDSELIVKQLNGEYKVKNSELKTLFNEVKKLEEDFYKINYSHVSRQDKFQRIADKLVNKALSNIKQKSLNI